MPPTRPTYCLLSARSHPGTRSPAISGFARGQRPGAGRASEGTSTSCSAAALQHPRQPLPLPLRMLISSVLINYCSVDARAQGSAPPPCGSGGSAAGAPGRSPCSGPGRRVSATSSALYTSLRRLGRQHCRGALALFSPLIVAPSRSLAPAPAPEPNVLPPDVAPAPGPSDFPYSPPPPP